MLFFLAFLLATAQAALVKVDSASDPLFIYVNGALQGTTPIILNLRDGSYRIDARWDEFDDRSLRYSLEVYGQTKGKLTVDWDQEEWRILWLEDLQRQRQPEPEPEPYEDDPYEDDLYDDDPYDDDLDRYDRLDVYDEEEDEPQADPYGDERERARQEALRLAEEALLGAEQEAEARREALEEELRRAEAERLAAEERARELAERERRLSEERKRLEEESRREREAEERRLAEERKRREAAERKRAEAEERARREAEAQARREAEERKRAEAEAARKAEEERKRAEAEAERRAEEEARRARYLPHLRAAEGHLAKGDAHRAVRAYREAIAAGENDPETKREVKKLEASLCTISLKLTGLQEETEPTVLIVPPKGEPFPADKAKGNRLTFGDVPAGVPLTLQLGGTGYERGEVAVEKQPARRTAWLNSELTWRGVATIELQDWPTGVTVAITDIHDKQEPEEEGEVEVTAGKVVVALAGPSGKRQFLLELEPDSAHPVSIKDQLPGAVRVAGIPSGTKLAWVKAPEGAPRALPSLARDSFVTEQQGVGIAEPQLLEGLPPGAYQLSLWHPVLGKTVVGFEPVPGEVSEQHVAWESMSKGPAVQAAYLDWQRRLDKAKKMPLATKLAIGSAGATVAAAGVSSLFLVQGQKARSDISGVDSSYQQALSDGDYESAWDLFAERTQLEDGARATNTLFFGGIGVTALGAGASVTLYLRGRAKKNSVEDWDLYSLRGLPSSDESIPVPVPRVEPPPPEDDPDLFDDEPQTDPDQFRDELDDDGFELEGE